MVAVKTVNLTKKFGDLIAVNDLNLQIEEGEIFGLVGPDGAGKTTILRLLTAVLEATAGQGWVYDKDIIKESDAVKEFIAYMPQHFGLYEDLTVIENMNFYADIYCMSSRQRIPKIETLLEFSNLKPCGILTPTSGTGQVGGFDINRQQYRIKETIGYMSQKFSLYDDLTIEKNIDFYSGIYKLSKEKKESRKDRIMKMTGLEDLKSNLTGTLSAGFKQRLAFGCAVIHEPQIVFLDEPTSGIDPIARENFWILIRQMAASGVTIFVTTHYMDDANNCDRISMIYDGTIIAMGSPEELKKIWLKEMNRKYLLRMFLYH